MFQIDVNIHDDPGIYWLQLFRLIWQWNISRSLESTYLRKSSIKCITHTIVEIINYIEKKTQPHLLTTCLMLTIHWGDSFLMFSIIRQMESTLKRSSSHHKPNSGTRHYTTQPLTWTSISLECTHNTFYENAKSMSRFSEYQHNNQLVCWLFLGCTD